MSEKSRKRDERSEAAKNPSRCGLVGTYKKGQLEKWGGELQIAESSPTGVVTVDDDFIRSRILTVRGVQVMLDRDLATLYGVEVKRLNQQVNRNLERFPERFMHQMTAREFKDLKLQLATSSCGDGRDDLKLQLATSSWGGVRKPPRIFTEQGISMLSAVLHTPTAIEVSIRIMDVFVAMRKALASVAPLLTRLDTIERRQIADQTRNDENQRRNEERFDTIFKAMDGGDFPPQKVFFEGRHYDAYSFAKKLVRKAAKSIVLVDGYCDEVTLDILAQKKGGVAVVVATAQKMIDKHLTPIAVEKFNKQNPTLTVKAASAFHDRFLILDGKELYHFGASLKDLGRQYCAITKMDALFIPSITQRI